MAVSDALTALQTRYTTDAALLSDAKDTLRANLAIARWHACATACAALEAHDVSSYSYAGKSVTRKDLPGLSLQADALLAEVESLLYGGGVILVDGRGLTDSAEGRSIT